jgi:hypothetical protein
MAQITWNNAPDYDEWGWDSFWSCDDWITWHKRLVEHFGEATAKEIWDYAFKKTTNLSSNLDCISLDSAFRAYVKKNNLKVYEDLITDVIGGSNTLLHGAVDTTENVASGLLGTINSLVGGDNLKKTINIVLIVAGVIGVAYVYKAFKKE